MQVRDRTETDARECLQSPPFLASLFDYAIDWSQPCMYIVQCIVFHFNYAISSGFFVYSMRQWLWKRVEISPQNYCCLVLKLTSWVCKICSFSEWFFAYNSSYGFLLIWKTFTREFFIDAKLLRISAILIVELKNSLVHVSSKLHSILSLLPYTYINKTDAWCVDLFYFACCYTITI